MEGKPQRGQRVRVTVVRRFRGCRYEIRVAGGGAAPAAVRIEGRPVEGGLPPVVREPACRVDAG